MSEPHPARGLYAGLSDEEKAQVRDAMARGAYGPVVLHPKDWEDLKPSDEEQRSCDCGYPEDSFACKIRHIQVNTGSFKAANG